MSNIEIARVPKRLSKKQSIYQTLLGQIQSRDLPVGSRVPNAAILAEQFSVSYVTMHAALNELTRDGWLVRHPKNGTFVAEPKRPVVKTVITLFLPVRDDIVASGNAVKTFEIVAGVTQQAAQLEWEINVRSLPSYPKKDETASYLQTLENQAGAIFIGVQYRELIDLMTREQFPTVVVDGAHPIADVVTYSRPNAIERVVEHFVGKGHRRIGYFGQFDDPQGKHHTFLRLLAEEGLAMDPSAACHCQRLLDVESCAKEYLRNGPPCDAVFIDNYQIAVAFAQASRECGVRVPRDLDIVALGDESEVSPLLHLDYIKIPYFEFGREAISLLQEQLPPASRKSPRQLSLPTQLVLRN